jgi:mono/diheme cytochrome c family protein
MKKVSYIIAALAALTMMSLPAFADDMPDGAKVFKKKCKMCHAINKKKVGPAVMNMNADAAVLKETITNGRKRMPKFGHKLSEQEIDALVAFLQENQAKVEE